MGLNISPLWLAGLLGIENHSIMFGVEYLQMLQPFGIDHESFSVLLEREKIHISNTLFQLLYQVSQSFSMFLGTFKRTRTYDSTGQAVQR